MIMNNENEEISKDDSTILEITNPTTNSTINIKILYPISTKSILSEYINKSKTTNIHYFYNNNMNLKTPHLIKFNDNDQNGVIFPLVNDFYGYFNFENDNDNDNDHEDEDICESNEYEYMNISTPSELINKCEKLTLGESKVEIDNFSMKPPPLPPLLLSSHSNINTTNTNIEDIEEVKDPIEFLTFRYYSTLYSLKDPLSYFPKTALPRFKNLCIENKSTIIMIDLLKNFCLNINEFDNRHNHKYGILSISKGLSKIELIEQDKFKSRNGFLIEQENNDEEEIKGISLEKLSQLILDLKIREAQLQIITIFEILSMLEINENEFLEKNKKIQKKLEKIKEKKAKLSLIGKNRRKKEKKVQKEVDDGEELGGDEYLIYQSLNNLIDRLNLWDTLSTRAEGAGTYGFMAYVLVPYFNKKLPNLMKHVIENMKGLNMKLISSKRKKHENDDKNQQDSKKSKSKFRKVLLDKKPPSLSKSDTIIDSEDFKPLTSLKRSQSNLSTKMLSKREVDLNIKTKPESLDSNSNSTQSFIFRSQLKRSKSTTTTTTSTMTISNKPKFRKSLSQVEATPAKSRVINISQSQVQATPVVIMKNSNSIHNNTNNFNSLSQIEATPDTSIHSPPISTPLNKFIKPDKKQNSINEKLLSASKEIDLIQKTPIKSTTTTTTNNTLTMIEATPGYLIDSSPLKNLDSSHQGKPKPGEPIPIETSPLLNVLRDSESLIHKMKPVNLFNDHDHDYEYDSDELLNPNKNRSNKTYSKKRH